MSYRMRLKVVVPKDPRIEDRLRKALQESGGEIEFVLPSGATPGSEESLISFLIPDLHSLYAGIHSVEQLRGVAVTGLGELRVIDDAAWSG